MFDVAVKLLPHQNINETIRAATDKQTQHSILHVLSSLLTIWYLKTL